MIANAQTTAAGRNSFFRFFVASLLGLSFDIALAAVVHHVFALPLIVSASVSLLCAAVLMYFVHEFWTFRSSAGSFSATRLSGTVMSALLALASRSISLLVTSQWLGLGDQFALVQLVSATGISFVLNYVVVRWIMSDQS
ncbi:GtrA family protein [Aureimonas altamirensis]|uniref:GtrA family protein n=1 Tax=Aureimonas altamirensis TaxID=370622 RepID=UPI002036853D|nr:GtrA family protein [Aureimonas altamirensis]MCM2505988.1 GtrA family protein [Aureimonas altamirensis]